MAEKKAINLLSLGFSVDGLARKFQGRQSRWTYFLFLSHLLIKIKHRKEVIIVSSSTFETTDLFRRAFFLSKGGKLSNIRIRNNGKLIASFLFTGNGLDQLEREYRSGKALVNPLQYRESLNYLRDILFEKLQENKRSKRYDRRRKNRSYQEQC